MCCSVSEWSFASQLPLSQCRMRTLSSPSSVILLPPSMTVSWSIGRSIVAVTLIVTGSSPQSKVMIPPCMTAALSLSNVQLAALPSPTTVVGLETSAGLASSGSGWEHLPSGLPALATGPVLPPELPASEPPLLPPSLLRSPPALDCPPLPELELPRPPLPPPTFCARPPLPDVCSPAAAPPEPLLVAAPPVPLIAAAVESSSSPPHAQNSRHAIGQTIARRWVLTQSSPCLVRRRVTEPRARSIQRCGPHPWRRTARGRRPRTTVVPELLRRLRCTRCRR